MKVLIVDDSKIVCNGLIKDYGYGFNLFNSLALSFRLVTARMTTVPGRRR